MRFGIEAQHVASLMMHETLRHRYRKTLQKHVQCLVSCRHKVSDVFCRHHVWTIRSFCPLPP